MVWKMKSFYLVCVSIVLNMLTIMTELSSTTDYIISLGGSFQLSSTLYALRSLMMFLSNPVWGILSECIGKREVMLYSALGNFLLLLFVGLCGNLNVFIVCRVIQGFFMSYSVGAISYIIETTPLEHQSQRLSYAGSMFGFGFLFSSFLGGPLASYNISFPTLAASYFALMNTLLLLSLPPLPITTNSSMLSLKQIYKTLSTPLKISALWPILILRGIGEIGTSLIINSTLEQLRILKNFQLSPQGRSFYLLEQGIISTISIAIIPQVGKRGGEVMKISIGFLCGVVIIFTVCWIRNLEFYLFLMGLYAACTGFQSTLLNTMASLIVTEDMKSVVVSYGECMVALGGIAGPALAGSLITFNENYPFYVYCVLISLGVLQFWLSFKRCSK